MGGRRQRTILALLLLSTGCIVSVDAMVEAIWHGDPPATARTQVAICIAGLRKAFKGEGAGDQLIVTAHPGYQLNADGHRVDLLEFGAYVAEAEQAVAQGRVADASELYELALGLWRGPVLSGVTGRSVEDEADRLEELRLATFDSAVELQLALGRHHEVIGRLATVVQERPLRERARHSLMLAQYRAGHRAEATGTFREGRRQFIEELGLEPGPALQELHDAILRDDPALAPPELPQREPERPDTPVTEAESGLTPSTLPPNIPAFTGRTEDIAALDQLVAERSQEQPPAIGLITGVAGVGKTALAVYWAHRVATHFMDGRLFADLRGHDETHEPTTAAEILSRFLRLLGLPSEQIPADLNERAALYQSLLADRRVLVVLDNARTIDQIRPLLPNNGFCAALVTSRVPIDKLILRYGALRIQLGVLSKQEAVALLARIVPENRIENAPEQAEALCELCDRLPLALRIAAARLASKPHWTVKRLVDRLSSERRRLDELSQGESQVRASFALSYQYLSQEAAQLYRRLGLLEVPDFTAWVAAALVDVELFEAERLMEHLVDVQLLDVVGTDGTGQLRYRLQNLLRLFAIERVEQEESDADRAVSRDRALRTWLTIAEHAHRKEYGGDYSIIHSALPRVPVDPEAMAELTEVPLDWYEAERLSLIAVIDHAARLNMDELAWDLSISTVVLFETRNYVEDWLLCCERALAVARASGNTRGEAMMLESLGAARLRTLRLEEAASDLSMALRLFEKDGEEHGRALALRSLALVDRTQGDLGTAGVRLSEAVDIFRSVGDASSEAHALGYLAQTELDLGRAEGAVRFGLESVRISKQIGETRGAAQAVHRLGRAYLMQGRLDSAEEAFLEVARIVREKGDLLGIVYAQLGLSETRLGLGMEADAEAGLTGVLEVVGRIDNALAEGRVNLALGLLRARQGRTDEARQRMDRAIHLFRRAGSKRDEQKAAESLAGLTDRTELVAETNA